MSITYAPIQFTDTIMNACVNAFWQGEQPLPAPTYDGMITTLLEDRNHPQNWVYFGQAKADRRILVEFPQDPTTYLCATDANGYFGFGVKTDDPDLAMATISVTVVEADEELSPQSLFGFHPLQLPAKDRFDVYHELMFGDIPKVRFGDFEFTWHTTLQGFTAYFGYGPANTTLPMRVCGCAEHEALQTDGAGFVVFGAELPVGLEPQAALWL
ncbi:hypothetical protein [Lacticaseibacillus porcinae]|uniref:hypothetical protein n=1 Tax=Lacticaseibacillus porcinae TaxID=1123687 RepID=UPI000F79BEE6|nr:hypothetical protein [Lacticaseibacillus porcinae]